ncbi:hypothetical protein [Psychrobacillus sp. MER TA 171]|uniref:hypothetical protein n=1 Tax=Psychrobacillus sp. MER TA 171 TaxID=2939577 RepID=UPI00203BA2AF|nr:hypothetical protein [Psychrobacillus sp. MER TA 171]MCM3356548.1 hypothetical protein [Psychrobacillus sp. MER TA 171]
MKKLKVFSIIALAVIIAGGGYLLYLFNFKEYDVADEEVKEIVEKEPYKVELPGGITILMDENGEVVEETTEGTEPNGTTGTSDGDTQAVSGPASAASNSNNASTPSQSTGKTASSGTSSSPKPSVGGTDSTLQSESVDTIMEKYRPAMEGLESQADTKINALVGRAKTEYSTKKANGESIDYGYFYNKYMAAAKDLEGNTDKVFNAVLKAVEKDLAANGHDQSQAKAMKKEYEAKKKARRDGILSQVMGN